MAAGSRRRRDLYPGARKRRTSKGSTDRCRGDRCEKHDEL